VVTQTQSKRHRAIIAYLHEVLGVTRDVRPSGVGETLPAFLRDEYEFAEATLLGHNCTFLIATGSEDRTPIQVEKHCALAAGKTNRRVIYVADHLTSYQRRGLIERKINFLVPQMQLFLPFLAVDLRERFIRAQPQRLRLRPASQATMLYWFYHGIDQVNTPGVVAKQLGYSKMSTSRVFDELEATFTDVAALRFEYHGRERRVTCDLSMRELWEKAQTYFKSPVQKCVVGFRSWFRSGEYPPVSGLSALAEHTPLMHPQSPTYAMTTSEVAKHTGGLRQLDQGHGEPVTIEVWRYSPSLHARGGDLTRKHPITADPLSVYLSFRESDDASDDRLAAALEDLVKAAPWR